MNRLETSASSSQAPSGGLLKPIKVAPSTCWTPGLKRLALCVLLGVCPLFLLGLSGWSLFDPDEARYAEIPREMLARHDWVTPTLNYIKFFDKPPLLYWGIATSYSLLGLHEGAARLVPALAALLGLAMAFVLGRRMFGLRAGLLSALILGTSVMWTLMARVVVTDMLVSSLVFTALALWWLGHTSDEPKRGRCFLSLWIVLGLGVLAKGPIEIVLSGGSIFLYLLLCRQWGSLRAMRWGTGLVLLLLISAPWFVLVAQRNAEFNHFFWYEQHIRRFLGRTVHRDHVQGRFYFFEFLPLIFFPWSLLAPAALLAGSKQIWPARSQKQRAVVFLGCACAFIMLFFSASDSKLVTYILPVLPPLSILLAAYFDRLIEQRQAWSRALSLGALSLAALLVVVAAVGVALGPRALRDVGASPGWAIALGSVLLLWGLSVGSGAWRRRAGEMVAAVAGGFVVVMSCGFLMLAHIAPGLTTAPLIQRIRPGLMRQGQMASLGFIQSLSFYTGQRVYLLGHSDELFYGIQHMSPAERSRWILKDETALRRLMASPRPVYFWIRNSKAQNTQAVLAGLGAQATPIARNYRYTVFGNRVAIKLTPPALGSTGPAQ